ncbi:MAG: lycopene cyclase family protein [Roseiflexus sp.]|nr:lycopene cyclase family protein [Roseiflexus sp.]MCS7287979.1 lycopene cyclase family protein [Roseiflexus sp.]MDW8234208.1 lycopene cyclase family protein [Roseiflexaceae bacterium]
MDDVLVVGAGPTGLAIAAALSETGLRVAGLSATAPTKLWQNTYGVWLDELPTSELRATLGYRWSDVVVHAGRRTIPLHREYGLFDNQRLQQYLLERGERHGVVWHTGVAAAVEHRATHSLVTTRDGRAFAARLVVDASGHSPALLRRPAALSVARQAAYGIVGEFSAPPVQAGQMVLMDYRADHLTPEEQREPPTFLYAMDLGGGQFFVEETSLAHVPGVPLSILERRLRCRLDASGVAVRRIVHIERCLFPMNNPLPYLDQPMMGFGGAASMVHPPSGYMVGKALRRAPEVARAIAQALGASGATPLSAARAGWQALWSPARLRRRQLYLFGLASLMRCDSATIQEFFEAFFSLPRREWTGYLSDTLSTAELARAMLRLFVRVPWRVRRTLIAAAGAEHALLRRAALGRAA